MYHTARWVHDPLSHRRPLAVPVGAALRRVAPEQSPLQLQWPAGQARIPADPGWEYSQGDHAPIAAVGQRKRHSSHNTDSAADWRSSTGRGVRNLRRGGSAPSPSAQSPTQSRRDFSGGRDKRIAAQPGTVVVLSRWRSGKPWRWKGRLEVVALPWGLKSVTMDRQNCHTASN